MQIKFSV